MAAAVAGGRALFIDGDLRRPGRFSAELGLSQILANLASFEDAVVHVPIESTPDATPGGHALLDVLPSGPLPPNPVDLMNSSAMRDLVARSEEQYDLVVFDAPPLTVVSDAIPVASRVSGLIVVARIGHTHRHAIRRMVEQLELLSVPILGVVVNAVRRDDGYGYGYGYGYGPAPAAAAKVPELAARD
jgi:receptor protein-tyrosine kinase